MDLNVAREQIAEKLAMDVDAWVSSLDDCVPGHYGVQDWEVSAHPEDIWVDFPSMSFTFKEVDFDFEIRQGGSREDDSMDMSFNRKASGTGKFECSGSRITNIYDLEIEFDLDLTEDGKCTRI